MKLSRPQLIRQELRVDQRLPRSLGIKVAQYKEQCYDNIAENSYLDHYTNSV